MQVRALDANGDMTMGYGSANFLANSSAAVAQNVITRLKLIKGEWFLDITAGTDWPKRILGRRGAPSYDGEIRRVILGTTGVVSILSYSSTLNDRKLTVLATISTQYSQSPFPIQVSLP
jgi:hypothetical protein